MKRISILMLVFLAVGISGIGAVPAQSEQLAKLREKIDGINKLLDEASKNYDYATMAAYYEDDVILLPNGEPILQGKQAVIENEKKAEQAGYKILGIETSPIDFFHSADYVHEIGAYKITLKVPGVPFNIVDQGKYLVIWKIHPDGSLKIKLETWNNNQSHQH